MQVNQNSGFMRAQDAISLWKEKKTPEAKRFLFGVILKVRENSRRGADSSHLLDFDTDVLEGASTLRLNDKMKKVLIETTKTTDEREWAGLGLVLTTREYEGFAPGFVIAKVVDKKTAAKKRTTKPKYSYVGVGSDIVGPEPNFDGLIDENIPY